MAIEREKACTLDEEEGGPSLRSTVGKKPLMEEQEKLLTWGVKCERPFVRVVRDVKGIPVALHSCCFLHGGVARRRLIEGEGGREGGRLNLYWLLNDLSLSRQRGRLHRKRLRRRSVMHFRGSSFPPLTLSLQILLLRRRQRSGGRQKGSPHPPIASPRGVGGRESVPQRDKGGKQEGKSAFFILE